MVAVGLREALERIADLAAPVVTVNGQVRGPLAEQLAARDVFDSPGAVRDWLRVRVLDGATWDEACDGLGWSRAYAATVRAAAAEWLMQQFEGVAK